MKAVASVTMNRVNATEGEYARVSQGGNLRNIIFQQGQFDCARESIGSRYNSQNIYNMNPTDIHYNIADWAVRCRPSFSAISSFMAAVLASETEEVEAVELL